MKLSKGEREHLIGAVRKQARMAPIQTWIDDGALKRVGGGWYEVVDQMPEDLLDYAKAFRERKGKPLQVKFCGIVEVKRAQALLAKLRAS